MTIIQKQEFPGLALSLMKHRTVNYDKKTIKKIEERTHVTYQDPRLIICPKGQGFQTQEKVSTTNNLRMQNSPFPQMESGKALCRISLGVLEQLKMY